MLENVGEVMAVISTARGLEVGAWLDERDYSLKIEVSDEVLATASTHRTQFHGARYRVLAAVIPALPSLPACKS